IAWSDARQTAAGALADGAEHVILRHQTFHHGKYSLVQRNIDHLAATGSADITVVHGHQRADCTVHSRQGVPDADPDPHRRAIRIPSDIAHAAHRFTDTAEARTIAVRAVLPESGNTHEHKTRVCRMQLRPT